MRFIRGFERYSLQFFLCLTDITKIGKILSLYGRFVFIDEISDKTLFEEGVLYHIGKK